MISDSSSDDPANNDQSSPHLLLTAQNQQSVFDDKPKEKCGIFGVYEVENASKLTYYGLYALQHRGQEASGIASFDGKKIHVHKKAGLVTQVYKEEDFHHLAGEIAIGHNRYSTSGGSFDSHIQPVHPLGDNLALVHNGNLPSTTKLEKFLSKKGIEYKDLNDSAMMYEAIKWFKKQHLDLPEAVSQAYPLFTGAFCILVMDASHLVAAVDPCGIRPLCLGKLNGGFVVASESCALDIVGAKFIREIEPGEMVVMDKSGIKSYFLVRGKRKLDIFEFVYFARPDSNLLGKSVYEVRRNFGKTLAKEYPIKADLVIPVPESAIPAAIGYSHASGIPFEMGLIKNRYIGRTFIMPDQRIRDLGVRIKLNPIPMIRGKKIIVVDDSIVRGTTIKKIVAMLRDAGAKEVHVIISSPPVKFPDFYGIDTPKQEKLIGSMFCLEEITKLLNADSVNYLSYNGMIRSTELPESVFSTSHFTGVYPLDLNERQTEIHNYPISKV